MEGSGAEAFTYLNRDALRYRLENSPFFERYLLNPSVQLSDIPFALITCCVLLLLRMALCGGIHPRLIKMPSVFRWMCFTMAKETKVNKMAESIWYTLWHTVSFCWGMYVLWNEWTATDVSWISLVLKNRETKWLWAATDSESRQFSVESYPLMPPSDYVIVYYLVQFGFWLSSLLFICFETIRHDFRVLVTHHIATCLLIGLSYICCFWRIGCLVLVLHDVVDIFLYSTKALNYSHLPKQLTDAFFVVFALVYLMARLVIYPLFCVFPSLDIWTIREITGGVVQYHWHVPGACALTSCLCVLQVLHVFWFYLIMKIFLSTLFKKGHVQGDIRSDDEGSSDEGVKED